MRVSTFALTISLFALVAMLGASRPASAQVVYAESVIEKPSTTSGLPSAISCSFDWSNLTLGGDCFASVDSSGSLTIMAAGDKQESSYSGQVKLNLKNTSSSTVSLSSTVYIPTDVSGYSDTTGLASSSSNGLDTWSGDFSDMLTTGQVSGITHGPSMGSSTPTTYLDSGVASVYIVNIAAGDTVELDFEISGEADGDG